MVSPDLVQVESDFGLEPHSFLLDETDDDHGSIADQGGETSKVIEYIVRVQYPESENYKDSRGQQLQPQKGWISLMPHITRFNHRHAKLAMN